MNFASVHQLPVVFVVNNNRWAISVPLHLQTAAATIAQKAIASGMHGEQVDGNDVMAVREGVAQAITAARAGEGPSLIEALTYRLGDHTTADDARRYRSDAEVKERWQQEPIARLKKYLVAQGVWSKEDEEALVSDCQQQVEAAAARYLAAMPPSPQSVFDHLYAELPAALAWQRDQLAGDSHE
jgi:pyruvate dehydrogenase E1 component alpha subunit